MHPRWRLRRQRQTGTRRYDFDHDIFQTIARTGLHGTWRRSGVATDERKPPGAFVCRSVKPAASWTLPSPRIILLMLGYQLHRQVFNFLTDLLGHSLLSWIE
jgi:hypothetical protein